MRNLTSDRLLNIVAKILYLTYSICYLYVGLTVVNTAEIPPYLTS